MPQFRYEVKKGPGAASTGVLEAESERAALARLREMGYFPLKIELSDGDEGGDALKFQFTRIRLTDRNIFFRQLANLYESGMPLTRALTTLMQQGGNPKMVRVIEQVRDDIQQGTTLAEALERHEKIFSPMTCNLVRAGETGGMLDEVFWRIVTFGEQEEELRGKATTAMIYPAFLLLMGITAVFILMSFVFPKFALIFDDFNVELPWPTRVVMATSEFMGSFWWAVLIALGVLVAAFVSYYRTEEGRFQLDLFALKSPLIGTLINRYEMARFARTLGTLLDNGVPILTSMRITTETIGNRAIQREVATIHGRVAEGDSISDTLQHCKYFPPMVVNMIAVGEESGRLGAVTKRVAEAYDNEVDRAVKAIASMMEPILIVFMGILIGFLVIAMLLPMLTLSANIE